MMTLPPWGHHGPGGAISKAIPGATTMATNCGISPPHRVPVSFKARDVRGQNSLPELARGPWL